MGSRPRSGFRRGRVNYRHEFHAGNFADVLKHVVIARIVEYLKHKDKAFRVIDTHAGSGLYDLRADEATRTGEHEEGIQRLVRTLPGGRAGELLAPYVSAIAACNPRWSEGRVDVYPGSPVVVRHLLRSIDRLTAIELHPQAAAALESRFEGDWQVRVIRLDGWLALGAHLPPKEKRGLVLVDPPFEKAGEFDRLIDGLTRAHRRWPGGVFALWYPIKDRPAVDAFRAALTALALPRTMDVVLEVRKPSAGPRLDGSGMIVVNPPYTLAEELTDLLPALQAALGAEGQAAARWLVDEAPAA
jgi:23S rRNA (adenine2030-N6)-methyltransferase